MGRCSVKLYIMRSVLGYRLVFTGLQCSGQLMVVLSVYCLSDREYSV